ncbi:lytic transglycosylase domain-containing protein [Limibaculum sp. M0105]|uniref:Lytic transglycosylase domain-containing protein n=1 Tax=Thermohalobaculum xanthum TaxID=2753746 RepID=A0A8J7M4M2_9RHOB|nr:lytic transglycosylase domain-containing protein [Thermohalobaculum xanthum]MBK0398108.1 lytic transglycosylase domain-containing protein [Thermohalobaculum xanthum]
MAAVVAVGLFVPRADAATAVPSPGEACLAAAEAAGRARGVPAGLLSAIALTESGLTRGGRFLPWPWTLNVEGKGLRFDGAEDALAHARLAISEGARSIDFGCFQINLRWHGGAFRSLDAMLDPRIGAEYAADFLRRLYEESGSWMEAAGHYHSRNAGNADRYRARVVALMNGLGSRSAPVHDVAIAGGGSTQAHGQMVASRNTATGFSASSVPLIAARAREGAFLPGTTRLARRDRAPGPGASRRNGSLFAPTGFAAGSGSVTTLTAGRGFLNAAARSLFGGGS